MQGSVPSDEILVAASATCHAWLDICAPLLYRSIEVSSSRISELIEDLSKLSRSRIAQHARLLHIFGPVPWLALPRLLKLLPHIENLSIDPPVAEEIPAAYLPALPRLTSVLLGASRNTMALTTISMEYLQFASVLDVLRLLASFPRLSSAFLRNCNVPAGPGLVGPVSMTHLNRLSILYRQSADPHDVHVGATLTQWWRWSHPLSDPDVGDYPGLHQADGQHISGLLKSLCSDRIL